MQKEPETDRELLKEYITDNSENAFSVLVRRYEAMVFGVCRRVTGDEHLAEEAFQAVFMVFMKKAGKLTRYSTLGGWFFRTAEFCALNAKKIHSARLRHEKEASVMRQAEQSSIPDREEYAFIGIHIDHMLSSLPQKQRDAVTLRVVQNKSEEDAARELGCPRGTLSSWVSRGLEKLRKKLSKKGMSVPAVAVSGVLSRGMLESAPLHITSAVTGICTGTAAASSKVLLITKAAMKTYMWLKLKLIAVYTAAVLTVGGAGVPVMIHAAGEARPAAGEKKISAPLVSDQTEKRIFKGKFEHMLPLESTLGYAEIRDVPGAFYKLKKTGIGKLFSNERFRNTLVRLWTGYRDAEINRRFSLKDDYQTVEHLWLGTINALKENISGSAALVMLDFDYSQQTVRRFHEFFPVLFIGETDKPLNEAVNSVVAWVKGIKDIVNESVQLEQERELYKSWNIVSLYRKPVPMKSNGYFVGMAKRRLNGIVAYKNSVIIVSLFRCRMSSVKQVIDTYENHLPSFGDNKDFILAKQKLGPDPDLFALINTRTLFSGFLDRIPPKLRDGTEIRRSGFDTVHAIGASLSMKGENCRERLCIINTDGSPMWKDILKPSSLYNDLDPNAVLSFGISINPENLFPFFRNKLGEKRMANGLRAAFSREFGVDIEKNILNRLNGNVVLNIFRPARENIIPEVFVSLGLKPECRGQDILERMPLKKLEVKGNTHYILQLGIISPAFEVKGDTITGALSSESLLKREEKRKEPAELHEYMKQPYVSGFTVNFKEMSGYLKSLRSFIPVHEKNGYLGVRGQRERIKGVTLAEYHTFILLICSEASVRSRQGYMRMEQV